MELGIFDLLVSRHADQLPTLLQPQCQPLVRPNVRILQIDSLQLGRRPFQGLARAKRLHQSVLGHPIQHVSTLHRLILESIQHATPLIQHVKGLVVHVA